MSRRASIELQRSHDHESNDGWPYCRVVSHVKRDKCPIDISIKVHVPFMYKSSSLWSRYRANQKHMLLPLARDTG